MKKIQKIILLTGLVALTTPMASFTMEFQNPDVAVRPIRWCDLMPFRQHLEEKIVKFSTQNQGSLERRKTPIDNIVESVRGKNDELARHHFEAYVEEFTSEDAFILMMKEALFSYPRDYDIQNQDDDTVKDAVLRFRLENVLIEYEVGADFRKIK
jgi:hypothetical protein